MSNKFKDLIIIAICAITLTLAIWLPHILAMPNFWGLNFSNGFATIYRNFDGLEYITIAKTFYNPRAIASLPYSLPANYYAAHFPGYSLLILAFAPLLGFLKSMLFIPLIFTVFSSWAFYFLVRDFKLSEKPLFLSILFLILPARWVIVHSVGSAEPMFIFFVITSFYFFLKYEKYPKVSFILIAGLLGLFAQLMRPPGILLFIALLLYLIWRKKFYLPLLFIPLGLLGIFYIYGQTYGDFWAYFHSGDNIHLTFPPFQVFNKAQFWVGDIWLEDIVLLFIFGFLGGMLLIKQRLYLMAFIVLTYLTASIFIAHRDISRYILPITPFLLIAFEKILTSREFKIILPIIILVIYLYAQNFIIQNVAPIPNLQPFN